MLMHPQFDPVAIQLGPLAIHWYGLMYLLAFAQFLLLGRMRVRQQPYAAMKWGFKDVEDILFWGVVGVILGGRLGYVMFYMPDFYLSNPLSIFKLWEGGMSFHGGLLGVLVALFWFAKLRKLSFFVVTDFVAPLVPLGLAFGRLGNFINGELWGRPSDWPWAMMFPAVDQVARHPSQLYQFWPSSLPWRRVLSCAKAWACVSCRIITCWSIYAAARWSRCWITSNHRTLRCGRSIHSNATCHPRCVS